MLAISQLLLTRCWWNFKCRFMGTSRTDSIVTFVQVTFAHNSTSAISQLLLTRFWWNFKGRFLGTSRTDSNCHGDICPGNICPGDIFPYQEYFSCYWPDLDETLKVGSRKHLEQTLTVTVTFVQATFVLATFVHIRNISALTDPILMKLYR